MARKTNSTMLGVVLPTNERKRIKEIAQTELRSESTMARILINEALQARQLSDSENTLNQQAS
ncbi:hypothetical protein [Neptuniibacter sp. CAU 1671]|uniref:hypothetical protein n=1 Tax=Neptuniibacter sp. CAU 1671 TaxID=3032593 RepID=UPI0023DB0872|nr:hypothetical protein [Neptuniibacter sp. CAU 1671]MDF2180970.1 hypothetical protein [Neptuniibacter sp. CAU 1671]